MGVARYFVMIFLIKIEIQISIMTYSLFNFSCSTTILSFYLIEINNSIIHQFLFCFLNNWFTLSQIMNFTVIIIIFNFLFLFWNYLIIEWQKVILLLNISFIYIDKLWQLNSPFINLLIIFKTVIISLVFVIWSLNLPYNELYPSYFNDFTPRNLKLVCFIFNSHISNNKP